MKVLTSLSFLNLIFSISASIPPLPERNVTTFAIAFSEILQANGCTSIVIFIKKRSKTRKLNELIQELHKISLPTYLFVDRIETYFDFIDARIKASVETSSLIFSKPDEIIDEIQNRNLAHRLCLFMFYWGLDKIENYMDFSDTKEPLKIVYITHPRQKVYRIYFNRNDSDGSGKMKMVNWYDATSLGLHHEPLLPRIQKIYNKLAWRTIFVPAVNVSDHLT